MFKNYSFFKMPRILIRKKGARPYRNYDPQVLIDAVEAVNKKKMTLEKQQLIIKCLK